MKKELIEKNLIVKLTFEFALDIINYCEMLESKRKFVVSNQLLKAGTSIGANAQEAQNAESKKDFIHKFKVAAKEMDETNYWLLLCKYAAHYPHDESLLPKLESISKIINKIIASSKKNSTN
ncbi:MAG: four helix bundle protein [Bacteroidetes bacterium]|nr:four helix bundle protein [Bacteroidota bacterium]